MPSFCPFSALSSSYRDGGWGAEPALKQPDFGGLTARQRLWLGEATLIYWHCSLCEGRFSAEGAVHGLGMTCQL